MWMPRTVSMPPSVRKPASSLARSSLESGFFSQKNTWCTTGANDALLAGVDAAARKPVAVAPTARAVAAKMTSRRLRSVMIGVLRWMACGSTSIGRSPDVPLEHHPLGPVKQEALGIVDAELAQHRQHALLLHPFGEHLQLALVADAGHRVDDDAADRLAAQVAHEAAVDLDAVHRQVLQVTERGHAEIGRASCRERVEISGG